MNIFTIKDLENLSGIKAHTIRIWEQRYSFLNPQRTETNIRYYSNSELQTILNIALLNKYGYKISHINRMTPVEMSEKILSLAQVQAQQERLVNGLITCMMNIEMDAFESLLDSYIHQRGIEKTILEIIFPFLERIGILWLTNHIIPAQEHLVSNVIRQKLVAGIDKTAHPATSRKSIILFLPEGEHHELGLLFMHYLLKSMGVKVLYLGADVPIDDIAFLAKIKMPDLLYTHLTSIPNNFKLDKFLNYLQSQMPDSALLVSGMPTQLYTKQLPPNITFKRSLSEVVEHIAGFVRSN